MKKCCCHTILCRVRSFLTNWQNILFEVCCYCCVVDTNTSFSTNKNRVFQLQQNHQPKTVVILSWADKNSIDSQQSKNRKGFASQTQTNRQRQSDTKNDYYLAHNTLTTPSSSFVALTPSSTKLLFHGHLHQHRHHHHHHHKRLKAKTMKQAVEWWLPLLILMNSISTVQQQQPY